MKKINKVIGSILVMTLALQPLTVFGLTKKETVYVNLDETGTMKKTTVNNHLTVNSKDKIEDETLLENILNINGKEKFTLNDQKLIWKGNGKDIFYRGTTKQELPISVTARYYLNGEEKQQKDIIGKKGQVKIEFDFTNHSYTYHNRRKLYTPFVTTVGMVLDHKENTNITVTNGKAIDTGSKNILVALASPGLYESTNIKELEGLDQITITYDTTKFTARDIYFVSTPKLLEETDFAIFNKLDQFTSSMSLLNENMDKIEKGAKELENGSGTLSNGMKELSENLNKALVGVEKLNQGVTQLDAGIEEIIYQLELAQKSINTQLTTEKMEGIRILSAGNQSTLDRLVEANRNLKEDYDNYQLGRFETEQDLITYFMQEQVEQGVIKYLVTCKRTYEANLKLIELLTMNVSTLDSFYTLASIIPGTLTELNQALNQVKQGTLGLNDGLIELKQGVSKLYQGSIQLESGASSLGSGAVALSNGITKFNEQGIKTLTSYTNKIQTLSTNFQELVELSKQYNGYGSNNATFTIFIYKLTSAK